MKVDFSSLPLSRRVEKTKDVHYFRIDRIDEQKRQRSEDELASTRLSA